MKFLQILFLILFITVAFSKQVQSQDDDTLVYSTYQRLLDSVKSKQNEIIVGVVTSSNLLCKRCDQAHDPLVEFQKKAKGMLDIYIIDCVKERNFPSWNNLAPVCNEHNMMPHITFFKQSVNDGKTPWPQDSIYTGAVDYHHFMTYVEQLTHNEVTLLDTARKLRNFVTEKYSKLKLIFFTEEEDTNIAMKLLSCQQRTQVQFGQIDSDSKLAKKYPNRTKTRQIVFLTHNSETDSYDETWFEGNTSDYHEIRQFIVEQVKNTQIKKQSEKKEYVQKQTEVTNLKVSEFSLNKIKEHHWVLYHLYEPGKPHNQFQKISDHYGALFKTYSSEITCNKCKAHASEQLGITSFPALIVYPQGEKEMKQFININNEEEISDEGLDELSKSFLKYIKATEKLLYNDDDKYNEGLFKQAQEQNQIPVIFYYDSLDPTNQLFMHVLTSQPRYKKKIKFFRFPDPNSSVIDGWRTTDPLLNHDVLPQIFTVLEISAEGVLKTSPMMETDKSYLNMSIFLNQVQDNEIINLSKLREVTDVSIQGNWERECQSGVTPCLIAMLSVHREARYQRELEQYKDLKASFPKKKVKWVWMDGYCREEILQSAGLDANKNMPTLIYYDNNKGKFKVMEDKWDQKNLEQFVQSIRRKDSVYQEIKNEFEIGNRNCKEYNEVLTKQYEEQKQLAREAKIEKERQNKKVYDELPVDYDEVEDDDHLDNYGMKRERRDRDRDDL